ncbi:hypothetical protein GGS23DRAFT_551187 [Durotheca rogersii]|uniref:uncharacterized protein n=1 Tax=Durotheca rogersii TaxID=419775 RepID=UPI0022203C10|nr:uncharacterized protein GGS23DRAFT_551187 [Durotheca rogersii]KAI5866582.1 hypothetical protein GGS23DRAFT_551187 [Durotheca rogersii]
MTPINFVTFLLSLYLVDIQYHERRVREHAERPRGVLPAWLLPAWLRRLLFRPAPNPYRWVDRDRPVSPRSGSGSGNTGSRGAGGAGAPTGDPDAERWFYHTKQRELMRMEAADAFELRRAVLLALCGLLLCAAWGVWRLVLGSRSDVRSSPFERSRARGEVNACY